MVEPDEDDEAVGSLEHQMLEEARRQTKALQTIVVLLEVFLFLTILGAVLWVIAILGS